MKFSRFFPEHTLFALRIFLPPFLVLVLAKMLFELLAFDFLDLNQILAQSVITVDEVSNNVTLDEFKARLLWLTSVLVYFFIMAGFAVFIWDTLKNSITKSTLWFFIVLASTITAVETILFRLPF